MDCKSSIVVKLKLELEPSAHEALPCCYAPMPQCPNAPNQPQPPAFRVAGSTMMNRSRARTRPNMGLSHCKHMYLCTYYLTLSTISTDQLAKSWRPELHRRRLSDTTSTTTPLLSRFMFTFGVIDATTSSLSFPAIHAAVASCCGTWLSYLQAHTRACLEGLSLLIVIPDLLDSAPESLIKEYFSLHELSC